MKLPDKVYDILKWIAIICIPAFKEAIPALFEIWHIPYGVEIADTLNILAVLIGGLISVSAIAYHKEQVIEKEESEKSEFEQYER